MKNKESTEKEVKKEDKIITQSIELPKWIETLKKAYEEYLKNGKI
jgi:hypothetical protein